MNRRNRSTMGESLADLAADLGRAWRNLHRRPAFTLAALAIVALGIGASTTIFSLVRGVVWRPLAYAEPERLVAFEPAASYSKRELSELRVALESLTGLAAWTESELKLQGDDGAQVLFGPRVTDDYLDVLGLAPALGGGFQDGDGNAGGAAVIVTDALWRQRLGGDPRPSERFLPLTREAAAVRGVLPPGVLLPQRDAAFVIPLVVDPAARDYDDHYLNLVGRLRPGVTLATARAELRSVVDRWRDERAVPAEWAQSVALVPLQEALVGEVRPTLLLLFGAVLLTLLIATANLAHLLLARALARRTELAVRAALGAGPWRLGRLLLLESTVLTLLGGLAGAALASLGVDGLVRLLPADTPRLAEAGVDGVALAFSLGLALVTGWLVGLAPAWFASRQDPRAGLAAGARTTTRRGWRGGLVIAEVALAAVLLVGAGVLLKSFQGLRSVDPGFRSDGLLSFTVEPDAEAFGGPDHVAGYHGELARRLKALPGVSSAAALHALPVRNTGWRMEIYAAARPPAKGERGPLALWRPVAPEYFSAAGIGQLSGRGFDAGDGAANAAVAILGRSTAERLFPDGQAIGEQVRFPFEDRGDPLTVVGVVEDVKAVSLAEEAPLVIYRPLAQAGRRLHQIGIVRRSWLLRTEPDIAGLEPAVLRAVREHDRSAAVLGLATMDEIIADSLARPRLRALLVTLFAAAAGLLGAVGIYGVMEHAVGERRRELGIRRVFGARRRDLVGRVLGDGARLALAGGLVGLPIAVGLSRFLDGLLYEVAALDPWVLTTVVAGLVTVGAVASWLPARRAAAVEPVEALRAD